MAEWLVSRGCDVGAVDKVMCVMLWLGLINIYFVSRLERLLCTGLVKKVMCQWLSGW